MASGKRARPNPPNKPSVDPSTSTSTSTPSKNNRVASLLPNTSSSHGMPTTKATLSSASTTTPSQNDHRTRKTKSWYGSWQRVSKSPASTEVARENIMGATRRSEATADFSRFETNKTDPSVDSNSQPDGTPHTPTEVDTKVDANSQEDESGSSARQPDTADASKGSEDTISTSEPGNLNKDLDKSHDPSGLDCQPPTNSNGWLSWLSRPAVQGPSVEGPSVQGLSESTHDSTTNEEITTGAAETTEPQDSQAQPSPPPPPPPDTQGQSKQTSSWFGVWSPLTKPFAQKNAEQSGINDNPIADEPKIEERDDVVMQDAPTPSKPAPATAQPSVGSTWAFWSRETVPKTTGEDVTSVEQGELAVIGDRSETSPKKSNVKFNEENRSKKDETVKTVQERPLKEAAVKNAKRGRPQSMEVDEPLTPRPGTPILDSAIKSSPSKSTVVSTQKTIPPNLLLPSFKSTYHMKENPSIIRQITQLLLRTQQRPPNHVFLSKERPRIKKAVAIGVHGLFPASYLRPMIGQPTGTSIRFAHNCAEAIRRWADSNGSGDCEIDKIALEGEGKIADRVDCLWKLLLNWIEHIKNADLIMLACHSQGVPVGIMLLAKLIDLGIITNSRIGVCAMAGVSLGPFPDYKSGMGMLMGTAAELWQFADPGSEISKNYEVALKTVVEYGARITYVGSIDDQLVPLQSALYGPACHPYIYRAVFIDGRIHAPDFIAHLVGFALKLRNLGISDHGLIRELSVSLAGSLYSGEGHSKLYNDGQVYDLAISHTLETTSVSGVPCQIERHEGLASPNPYVLPWIMRGLLEEEFVKTELSHETTELIKQFDDWTPTTKALKDVKYRLEAVRSKL